VSQQHIEFQRNRSRPGRVIDLANFTRSFISFFGGIPILSSQSYVYRSRTNLEDT